MWYQEDNVNYQVCSSTEGEDPNCSDSLDLNDSVSDHLTYLGVKVGDIC